MDAITLKKRQIKKNSVWQRGKISVGFLSHKPTPSISLILSLSRPLNVVVVDAIGSGT